jgi:hypothetical protein
LGSATGSQKENGEQGNDMGKLHAAGNRLAG